MLSLYQLTLLLLLLSVTVDVTTSQQFNLYRDYSHSSIRPSRYAKKSIRHDVSEYLSSRQKLMVEQRVAAPKASNSYSNTGSINSFYSNGNANTNFNSNFNLRGSRKLSEAKVEDVEVNNVEVQDDDAETVDYHEQEGVHGRRQIKYGKVSSTADVLLSAIRRVLSLSQGK
jgi:hypothetical protein